MSLMVLLWELNELICKTYIDELIIESACNRTWIRAIVSLGTVTFHLFLRLSELLFYTNNNTSSVPRAEYCKWDMS